MNTLDEVLLEIMKGYNRQSDPHQDYASQEDLKNKVNAKRQTKQNIFNNTFQGNLKDITSKINEENNKNINHRTVSKINKQSKINIDNRKDLDKGDIVRIIDGDYKALSDKKCKFLEYCKGMDKILLQLDELNPLYVNPEDIKLVRRAKKEYAKDIYNEIEKRKEKVMISIEEDILKVILTDGTTSAKEIRGQNKNDIIEIVYYKAKAKQYIKLRKSYIKSLTMI